MSEGIDAEIKKAVCEAAREPRAQVRARALEGMAAVGPARGLSRRWVIAAVGAAVLFGLGFVPIPMGKAPGALARAMAMASQATTVHMTGHGWTARGEFDVERWVTDDGFSRQEKWVNDELVELNITHGDRVLLYFVDPETGAASATEAFLPTNRYKLGELPAAEGKSYLARMFHSFEVLAGDLGIAPPDIEMTERRERSLWGGLLDVVEAEFTVKGTMSISGVSYMDGDMVRIKAEVDPETNRLLSMAQYRFEGVWGPTYRAEYEWDVDLPEGGEFRPPKGTKLTRCTWWEKRADQVLAVGTTKDWEVVLHCIDVNRRGDLVLSLHRAPRSESTMSRWQNGSVAWKVEAVDDAGVGYHVVARGPQSSYFLVGYGRASLQREWEEGIPRSVTLTIYPYPQGKTTDQSVTFRNIPLPPRQNVDDLCAAEMEVIQY